MNWVQVGESKVATQTLMEWLSWRIFDVMNCTTRFSPLMKLHNRIHDKKLKSLKDVIVWVNSFIPRDVERWEDCPAECIELFIIRDKIRQGVITDNV